MNGVGPLLGAGGTFAGSAVLGLLAGAWLARTTGQQLWAAGGLFGGMALGAYGAFRMLGRAIQR